MAMADNSRGYEAYARYQAAGALARLVYLERRDLLGKSTALVWGDITTACVRLSLSERRAFPENRNAAEPKLDGAL